MEAPLLSVEGLTVRFPGAEPVRELSFVAERGETLAIVGESGSGKSLTALALMGLLPAGAWLGSGHLRFAGRDITQLSERSWRDIRGREIAMIFQEPMTSLNPVLPVGYQITEVLHKHERLTRSRARRRAIELLDLVRIPDPHRRIDTYPHELSGGMRQRVMIAIAVACSPRLLIADEPTTALDVTIQAQVLELLDGLRRDLSMGLILITHDLGIVSQWADKVVVMYAGAAVEVAEAEQLTARPVHPYSRSLFAASPRVHAGLHYSEGPLREIPGSILSSLDEQGCAFAPRCDRARPSCSVHTPKLLPVGNGHLVACPVTTREVADGAAVRH